MNAPALLVYVLLVTVQLIGLLADGVLISNFDVSISGYCATEIWFMTFVVITQILIPISFVLHIYL